MKRIILSFAGIGAVFTLIALCSFNTNPVTETTKATVRIEAVVHKAAIPYNGVIAETKISNEDNRLVRSLASCVNNYRWWRYDGVLYSKQYDNTLYELDDNAPLECPNVNGLTRCCVKALPDGNDNSFPDLGTTQDNRFVPIE